MINETLKNRFWRKSLKVWAAEAREGSIDRREFLALATHFRRLDRRRLRHARPRPIRRRRSPTRRRRAASSDAACSSRIRRTRAPTTGRRWATSRASSSSRSCATRASSPSSRCCSRAGTSTATRPNMSFTCARARPGTTAIPSPPTTSSTISTAGATRASKAIRWPRAWARSSTRRPRRRATGRSPRSTTTPSS